jgi:hypothetical protein
VQKFVLVSIVAVMVVAPIVAARERNPRIALQKATAWTAIGIAFYLVALLFIYPRLLP